MLSHWDTCHGWRCIFPISCQELGWETLSAVQVRVMGAEEPAELGSLEIPVVRRNSVLLEGSRAGGCLHSLNRNCTGGSSKNSLGAAVDGMLRVTFSAGVF